MTKAHEHFSYTIYIYTVYIYIYIYIYIYNDRGKFIHSSSSHNNVILYTHLLYYFNYP